jgi:ferric-dicitrate binding protein FerR (iron transport regulator)
MNSASRKTFKIISVLAAICLFQVYVLAGATAPNVASNANSTSDANGLMLGRLVLAGTDSILVNGNSANSGTTILSGSQFQTPKGVEATVQLGSAGKLYIEPNSNLTLTFDKTNVDVKVAAGSAFVAANAGVTSSVTTPDGRTSTTAAEPGAAPVPKMSKKAKNGWIWGGIAAAAIIIIIIVVSNRNSSQA